MSLASWRSSKEVSVAAAERARGRVREMSLRGGQTMQGLGGYDEQWGTIEGFRAECDMI